MTRLRFAQVWLYYPAWISVITAALHVLIGGYLLLGEIGAPFIGLRPAGDSFPGVRLDFTTLRGLTQRELALAIATQGGALISIDDFPVESATLRHVLQESLSKASDSQSVVMGSDGMKRTIELPIRTLDWSDQIGYALPKLMIPIALLVCAFSLLRQAERMSERPSLQSEERIVLALAAALTAHSNLFGVPTYLNLSDSIYVFQHRASMAMFAFRGPILCIVAMYYPWPLAGRLRGLLVAILLGLGSLCWLALVLEPGMRLSQAMETTSALMAFVGIAAILVRSVRDAFRGGRLISGSRWFGLPVVLLILTMAFAGNSALQLWRFPGANMPLSWTASFTEALARIGVKAEWVLVLWPFTVAILGARGMTYGAAPSAATFQIGLHACVLFSVACNAALVGTSQGVQFGVPPFLVVFPLAGSMAWLATIAMREGGILWRVFSRTARRYQEMAGFMTSLAAQPTSTDHLTSAAVAEAICQNFSLVGCAILTQSAGGAAKCNIVIVQHKQAPQHLIEVPGDDWLAWCERSQYQVASYGGDMSGVVQVAFGRRIADEDHDSSERDYRDHIAAIAALHIAARIQQNELQRLPEVIANAQVQERRRISHDLHDTVGSNLGAIQLQIGMLTDALKRGPCVFQASISKIEQAMRHNAGLIRKVERHILPVTLYAGLRWAFEAYIDAQKNQTPTKLQATVNWQWSGVPGEQDASPDFCYALFLIGKQALDNAFAHARAQNVSITVTSNGDRVRLIVEDDGVGISERDLAVRQTEGHMGMSTMATRARSLGGTFTVAQNLPCGTRVECDVPMRLANMDVDIGVTALQNTEPVKPGEEAFKIPGSAAFRPETNGLLLAIGMGLMVLLFAWRVNRVQVQRVQLVLDPIGASGQGLRIESANGLVENAGTIVHGELVTATFRATNRTPFTAYYPEVDVSGSTTSTDCNGPDVWQQLISQCTARQVHPKLIAMVRMFGNN